MIALLNSKIGSCVCIKCCGILLKSTSNPIHKNDFLEVICSDNCCVVIVLVQISYDFKVICSFNSFQICVNGSIEVRDNGFVKISNNINIKGFDIVIIIEIIFFFGS